ncbi:MAG TPA: rhomboid family intramembrane serine protease [Rhizomicrobium sp.]|nr:rhomboid family intramembrane serine protease [Rhizomicrobium sp.]
MAFLHEQPRPHEPLLRVPATPIWLILFLALAHAGRVFSPPDISERFLINYAFIPARYSHEFLASHGLNPGSWLDRAVPFISYIFIHADWTHLAINSVWLLAFGAIVARRFGPFRFVGFFLLCGIAGAGTHLAFNWESPAPVIGASAAISGLMAAGFRMMSALPGFDSMAVHTGAYGPPPLAPLFSTRILLWSAVWAGVNVFAGMTGLGAGDGVRLIAWQAHLGGYLAGLVLVGLFDRLAPPVSVLHPSE